MTKKSRGVKNGLRYNALMLRLVDYSLTLRDFKALMYAQGGKCYICRRAFSSDLRPRLDHKHETNKFRGLLCDNCNTGIGLLAESTENLRRAIEYIESPPFSYDLEDAPASYNVDEFLDAQPRTGKKSRSENKLEHDRYIRSRRVALLREAALNAKSKICFKCPSQSVFLSLNADKSLALGACHVHKSDLPISGGW